MVGPARSAHEPGFARFDLTSGYGEKEALKRLKQVAGVACEAAWFKGWDLPVKSEKKYELENEL